MIIKQWIMDSRIGRIYLVASAKGLRGIYWSRQSVAMASSLVDPGPEAKLLAQAVRELEEYFTGKRREFSLPLDVRGTVFQEQVWEELRKIPYGKTCSYGEIASRLKNPKAFRAVGTANGKNPVSIIVPCHRVIAAGGKLGGYAGGLAIKALLLEIEQRSLCPHEISLIEWIR